MTTSIHDFITLITLCKIRGSPPSLHYSESRGLFVVEIIQPDLEPLKQDTSANRASLLIKVESVDTRLRCKTAHS